MNRTDEDKLYLASCIHLRDLGFDIPFTSPLLPTYNCDPRYYQDQDLVIDDSTEFDLPEQYKDYKLSVGRQDGITRRTLSAIKNRLRKISGIALYMLCKPWNNAKFIKIGKNKYSIIMVVKHHDMRVVVLISKHDD